MYSPASLICITPPLTEPLSLNDVKDYLRIDTEEDDTMLATMISAVRHMAEQWLRRSFLTQTWQVGFDRFAPAMTRLYMGPVQEVVSVKLYTREEEESALASQLYTLRAGRSQLEFQTQPVAHRVEITYITGYGNVAADVPAPLRQGMLIHLAAMYDGRAGSESVPPHVLAMYRGYRAFSM